MIRGIAERSEAEAAPQHSVVPINDEEFDIFLARLRSVSEGVLTLRDWELLLAACDRLIPRKAEDASEASPDVVEVWTILGPPMERVEPVDLNVEAFAKTWTGRIIEAVLQGFSAKRTFENSHRFGADEWVRLLTSFYTLASYVSPPVYPTFTKDLSRDLPKSIDSVRLANVIHSAEPARS